MKDKNAYLFACLFFCSFTCHSAKAEENPYDAQEGMARFKNVSVGIRDGELVARVPILKGGEVVLEASSGETVLEASGPVLGSGHSGEASFCRPYLKI